MTTIAIIASIVAIAAAVVFGGLMLAGNEYAKNPHKF